MKTFQVFILRYARDEVLDRTWKQVRAASMQAALLKVEKTANAGGYGARSGGVGRLLERGVAWRDVFEGVAAAVVAGEDYLVIASDTKQHVRVAHSVFIEQNEGY